MTGTLGRDHYNVNVLWRNDIAEVNVESVRKSNGLALCKVGSNVLLVELSLLLVGDKYHDNVRSLCSFGNGQNLESLGLSLSL